MRAVLQKLPRENDGKTIGKSMGLSRQDDSIVVGGDDPRGSSRFPWAPLMAISSCLLAHTVAMASLSTYMGVYTQQLLGLATLDMAGENERVYDVSLVSLLRW